MVKSMHTLGLFTVSRKSGEDALKVTVEINDRPLEMEIDTGASMSVIPADLSATHQDIQDASVNTSVWKSLHTSSDTTNTQEIKVNWKSSAEGCIGSSTSESAIW